MEDIWLPILQGNQIPGYTDRDIRSHQIEDYEMLYWNQ